MSNSKTMQICKDVADYLATQLPAATIEATARPYVKTEELEGLLVLVVPFSYGVEHFTRGGKEETSSITLGVFADAATVEAADDPAVFAEEIADKLHNLTCDSARCESVNVTQLYSLSELMTTGTLEAYITAEFVKR